ncbi:AAA family ATPase [Candidatus Palauibacter sp.]|uniref:AAA family ATPase n=1 Tax=Candidatus Palauibacter sp. TaxID=3101350 RepID=UPI003B027716
MIRHLMLKKYRSFESYTLQDLARVNLLVGRNNSGKTSILEAVHLLASQGDPNVFVQSTQRRGEVPVKTGTDGSADLRHREFHDVSQQFFGRRFEVGAEFSVSSEDGLGHVSATIMSVPEGESEDLFEADANDLQTFVLRLAGSNHKHLDLPLNADGSLILSRRVLLRAASRAPTETRPIRFLTTESFGFGHLAEMWDNVQQAGGEFEVIDAMRILENDLESIHFLAAPRRYGWASSGILLGFEPGTPRVPLGSHGEGSRRLLAISLSLTQLTNGFLLVDEIDTGLHWTVMEDMWRLVVETARKSRIQVFATTHSYDCVRGLASLLASRPDLAEEVSIQKVERSLSQAVAFDADNIKVAAEQSIELR